MSLRKNVRAVTALLALTAALSSGAMLTAGGAQATGRAAIHTAHSGEGSLYQLPAGGPCIVTGYSYHAQQRMAERRISSDEVENLVYSTCGKARKQSDGTWKYTGRKLIVICNDNGYVVTLWRP
ncbi:DUF4258 domain-containing protein [Streptomyces sp. YS-3]|uniref:DUF4258 domain-containing protein n=1 Tax=Streptomyces sp. YS-3 TaxID=3381352 RepID=UPI003862873F